ncbi:MAG: CapA family protein [Bacteroidaceae bacterium]|nr:CapA family protein [Bacteroidaceae bacterium]
MRKYTCIILMMLYSVTLSAQERITLLFVGDLMQHDAQIKAARTPEGYDYTDCFKYVKGEISSADIAVGNLEVVMGGKPYRGYPSFSAPDEFLYTLKDTGFDVLLTANNHCLDRGAKGLKRTVHLLDSLNIPFAGTYLNKEERTRRYPLLVEKNGFRIVFLNYTYGTNGLEPAKPQIVNYIDKEQIKEDISAARQMRPDAIIACMHWGIEYRLLPRKEERELADWLIAQGVDHIIGSHPHVLQPMEVRRDAHTPARHLVVYSLGNFISNMSKENTDGGAMVKLEIVKYYDIVNMISCNYSLIWTSRPVLSGKKNYEVYPASFVDKLPEKEELKVMNRFLRNSRELFEKHNVGIKEYIFE